MLRVQGVLGKKKVIDRGLLTGTGSLPTGTRFMKSIRVLKIIMMN